METLRKGAAASEKTARSLTLTMEKALDDVTASLTFQQDQQISLQQQIDKITEGALMNSQMSAGALADAMEAKTNTENNAGQIQHTQKRIDEVEKRTNSSVTATQALQLHQSQQVLIC